MKKILALLLTFAMVLSLAACGEKEEDPNAGRYSAVSGTALGMTMSIEEIYEGETWIELKTGGKGTIALDGDEFPIKWSLEDVDFTITIDGVDSAGTLADGIITIDLMDMGLEMVFVSENGAGPEMLDGPGSQGITYEDAGYWELVRIDSEDPDSVITQEDLALVKSIGITMYLELLPDGTGTIFIDDEMALQWHDGSLTFTEDGLTASYTVEEGELKLDMVGSVMVFRQGQKVAATQPAPMVSEMEQAGFSDFMEVGVPYAYTTLCPQNEAKATTGEVTVTSYEIVESAEKLEAKEGYEWRVVTMEARFFDDNARAYGMRVSYQSEDYYNTRLHDDSVVSLEEDVKWKDDYIAILDSYTVIHQGQEMEVLRISAEKWDPWIDHERIFHFMWAFQVPVGYDGCVAGVRDPRVEWLDGTYITDYDPADFLLFRLN